MRRHSKPNPSSVPRQGGIASSPEAVALVIGTRCEGCSAPLWPIGASCHYCAKVDEIDRQLRDHRKVASASSLESMGIPRLPFNVTDARLRREAEKRCAWGDDVPRLNPCACLPCMARRVLATVERERGVAKP